MIKPNASAKTQPEECGNLRHFARFWFDGRHMSRRRWRNLLFKRDESRRQLFFRSPDLNSLASRVWQLKSRVRTLSQQQQHNSSSYFKLFLGPHNSPFSTSTSSSSCVVHNSQAIPHSCFPPQKKHSELRTHSQTGNLFPPLNSSRKWSAPSLAAKLWKWALTG